jgi:hypothetical protein
MFVAFVGAGSVCSGRAQPGAVALSAGIRASRFGGSNLGIYNCRTIAGRAVRSTHGEGRAIDIGYPVLRTATGVRYANPRGTATVKWLRANAGRLGIQTIIWNRRIYSRRNPTGAAYRGVSPHIDHIHIELSWHAARTLNLTTVRNLLGTGANTNIPKPTTTIPRPDPAALVVAYQQGMRNPPRWVNTYSTRLLQRRLQQAGFSPGTIDARYGSQTRAAVQRAQRHHRITADGIAGRITVSRLWG